MLYFWLGFMTSLWLASAGATAYVIYRYVYWPWKRNQSNWVEAAKKFAEYEVKFKEYDEGLKVKRMVDLLSDEEVARIERTALARSRK